MMSFCGPLVLHICWHKKESCDINLTLLVKTLEHYSNKASTISFSESKDIHQSQRLEGIALTLYC